MATRGSRRDSAIRVLGQERLASWVAELASLGQERLASWVAELASLGQERLASWVAELASLGPWPGAPGLVGRGACFPWPGVAGSSGPPQACSDATVGPFSAPILLQAPFLLQGIPSSAPFPPC